MIVIDTVAEAIAGKYIDDLWSKITNKKYGEATEYVNEILETVKHSTEELKNFTEKAIQKSEYTKHLNSLESWTSRYKEGLGARNRNDKDTDLDDLEKSLKDPTSGVKAIMEAMHNVLTSPHEENNASLISLFMLEWEEKLASSNTEHLKHGVKWYLHEIDHFLKRQVEFQNLGLTLLSWVYRNDKVKFDEYRTNRKSAYDAQVKHAWDKMVPFVKRIKHGDHLPDNQKSNGYYSKVHPQWWWRFNKGDDARTMSLSLPHMGAQGGLNVWDMNSANICEWRFDPPLDQDDMVKVVNRSDVNRRIVAKWQQPAPHLRSTWDIYYTGGEALKVKIAPERHAPHFRMIPENESLSNEWLFGWSWRLEEMGVSQEENA